MESTDQDKIAEIKKKAAATQPIKQQKIILEGNHTPDLPLNKDEEVLMDVSQGLRDLGLIGKLFGHKGRLIVTNQRSIYFKKKTKDYDIEQMNMHHTGYVKMGYNLNFTLFIMGLSILLMSLGLYQSTVMGGLIVTLIGILVIYFSRRQGLVLSGSGSKIVFVSTSIPAAELSKIITICSANS
jgi:hypothetical protein